MDFEPLTPNPVTPEQPDNVNQQHGSFAMLKNRRYCDDCSKPIDKVLVTLKHWHKEHGTPEQEKPPA
ncbi:unnamed protein product [Fusarium venenatum]|uniref:Uncharacterized protein n=1 Tax=Fusarium venenatum TaxID=56646 RepID=A0A2L2TUG2_9HYPO|nr:uncharacterized protein FVRRES_00367 [Fusarium venenatum]CEI63855.1 unnamed protein product [Fusarium venenatum]